MVAIVMAWGLCFVAIRAGLASAPILWFAAMRSLVVAVVMVGVVLVRRTPLPQERATWLILVVLGVLNVTVAFGAMFAGVAGTSTGVAAVAANAQPLLILLPAWWLFGERPSRAAIAAVSLGFLGLVIMAGPGGGGRGAVVSLGSAAAITAATLLARRLDPRVDAISAIAWQFLVGALALTLVAGVVEGPPAISWSLSFIALVVGLGLLGTAVPAVLWLVEIRRSPLGMVTAWTLLVPLVGVLAGAVLLGEEPNRATAAGLLFVLASLPVASGLAGHRGRAHGAQR